MKDKNNFTMIKTTLGITPLGVSRHGDILRFALDGGGKECKLLLFEKGNDNPCAVFEFSEENTLGDVSILSVKGSNWENYEYVYEIDGVLTADPYGSAFEGRYQWGADIPAIQKLKAGVLTADFAWQDDQPLNHPIRDLVVYHLHVRGFTKHRNSKVREKGTYTGVIKKIPYLKDLGINAVELLPIVEFDEIIKPDRKLVNPYGKTRIPDKRNYWGYTEAIYMAPKAAYGHSLEKGIVHEFKEMVRALHQAGIEVILEFYFGNQVSGSYILDCLRYWVAEYHIDGFHLVGMEVPAYINEDAYLRKTKIFAEGFQGQWSEDSRLPRGEYHDGFLWDMRKVLKGDDEMARLLIARTSLSDANLTRMNYITNTNGFTLMDLVSYDNKHNEDNGEFNRDGRPGEQSWNCGIEGPTRKKAILSLRKRQIKNALVLVFLSQGVPLLLAGDEFGHSQNGNNNAYCQDNEISWLNFGLLNKNEDIYLFVKDLIAFRKKHSVFRRVGGFAKTKSLATSLPDISYHSEKAWFPELEQNRRQLGILYCGDYFPDAAGTSDVHIYITYNLYWESLNFALPRLPEDVAWYLIASTDNGFLAEEQRVCLEDQRNCTLPPRTIWILEGNRKRK